MSNFSIDVFPIKQGETKGYYIGKIKLVDLQKIAAFDVREESGESGFNRHIDENRIRNIKKYIIESNKEGNITLFPSPIILGFLELGTKDPEVQELMQYSFEDNKFEFKNAYENDYSGFKAFIVDGQHRFTALKRLNEGGEYNDIELSVTILDGYDLHELAQVFADVNFEAKPVNKSLYFDIFGSLPSEKITELRIGHLIVKELNSDKDSPFKGIIKMLGNEKNKLISQAFLVQKLEKIIKVTGIINGLSDKFTGDVNNDEIIQTKEFKKLYKFILDYFKVIKDTFQEYTYDNNNEARGLVFKTTGIGALLRLLSDFYEKDKYSPKNYEKIFSSVLGNIFSQDGEFGKGSSEGFQSKLYNKILQESFYEVEYNKISQFINDYDNGIIPLIDIINEFNDINKDIIGKIIRILKSDNIIESAGLGKIKKVS